MAAHKKFCSSFFTLMLRCTISQVNMRMCGAPHTFHGWSVHFSEVLSIGDTWRLCSKVPNLRNHFLKYLYPKTRESMASIQRHVYRKLKSNIWELKPWNPKLKLWICNQEIKFCNWECNHHGHYIELKARMEKVQPRKMTALCQHNDGITAWNHLIWSNFVHSPLHLHLSVWPLFFMNSEPTTPGGSITRSYSIFCSFTISARRESAE